MNNDNDNNNPNNNQLQIDLPAEVAQGVYSNLAIITHASAEFVVDFAQMAPGLNKASVRSRVIMAPEHAKRLMNALHENIARYEQQFGTIRMPEQQPRTINPFGMGKPGEA